MARAEVGALGAEKLKGDGLEEEVEGGVGLAGGGGAVVDAGLEKKLGTADFAGASVVLLNLTVWGVSVVVVEGP